MNEQNKPVLAMYDVRGIQKYIFRTSKVKDAIGASDIIENIIDNALAYAISIIQETQSISVDLEWYTPDGKSVKEYKDDGKDIQVLYIGGGNAFVTYSSRELCVTVNRCMSKYIMDNTYSLQLAVAICDKTDNYSADAQTIRNEMERVKASMKVAKPLAPLPVMKIDASTGQAEIDESLTYESAAKKEAESRKRRKIATAQKIFDNYVTEKGIDSTLAVIHIDGNNMGLRIRALNKGKKSYEDAVNNMREISFNINFSYKEEFDNMKAVFDENMVIDKKDKNWILPILVAGDDITFICNGKIALKAVKEYTKRITMRTMNGLNDASSLKEYGFSVCAGIAYFNSHFPFSVAYEVAEACCESAKEMAKKDENISGGKIGNWVDFHICKNVHAKYLDNLREKEYITPAGENLMIRPYFIPVEADNGDVVFDKIAGSKISLDDLFKNIKYFNTNDKANTFAKQIRNTYALGANKITELNSFLESRACKMPRTEQNMNEMYFESDGKKYASWYDALEVMELWTEED